MDLVMDWWTVHVRFVRPVHTVWQVMRVLPVLLEHILWRVVLSVPAVLLGNLLRKVVLTVRTAPLEKHQLVLVGHVYVNQTIIKMITYVLYLIRI